MPVKVRGMTYRPVLLEDLNDAVYFGQMRVFSDQQAAGSNDLKAAIANGSLSVLDSMSTSREFRPMTCPNLTPPAPVAIPVAPSHRPPAPAFTESTPSPAVEAALAPTEKVPPTEVTPQPQAESVTAPSQAPTSEKQADDSAGLSVVIKAIEDVGRKLDALSVSGPGVYAQAVLPEVSERAGGPPSIDGMYIPDIRVDDMSNHISLEARSLGQGGKVNSAIAALRGLQNKKNNNA